MRNNEFEPRDIVTVSDDVAENNRKPLGGFRVGEVIGRRGPVVKIAIFDSSSTRTLSMPRSHPYLGMLLKLCQPIPKKELAIPQRLF